MLRIYDKYSTMSNRLWNLQSVGKKSHNIIMPLFDYYDKSTDIKFNEHRKHEVKKKSFITKQVH